MLIDDKELAVMVALPATCDQGHALHKVLDLLVAADLDDHVVTEETAEEYGQRTQAEAALFQLAAAWAARKRMPLSAKKEQES